MQAPEPTSNVLSMTSPSRSGANSGIRPSAVEGARRLVALCRLRRDIGDARQFALAIVYVLNDYSDEIIREVIDPATGLPGRVRYPLEIADVKRACDASKMARDLQDHRQRQEVAARIASEAADVAARLRIVDLIRERGHDGEAVFQFMESQAPQNVRWFLDRYLAGRSITIGLGELIEDWQKAGSPPAPSRAA